MLLPCEQAWTTLHFMVRDSAASQWKPLVIKMIPGNTQAILLSPVPHFDPQANDRCFEPLHLRGFVLFLCWFFVLSLSLLSWLQNSCVKPKSRQEQRDGSKKDHFLYMFFFPRTKILLKAPMVPRHLIRPWSYIHFTRHLQRDTSTMINVATHVAAGPTLRSSSLSRKAKLTV